MRYSIVAIALLTACSSSSNRAQDPEFWKSAESDAAAAAAAFRQADPSMAKFFDGALGYAVFSEVTKGGAGIGAAHGNGILYEKGRVTGSCELSQVSVGAQLGGQSFREIIFFKDEKALKDFKNGDTEFSGEASAVAASKGAAATADYRDGVAVFSQSIGGLMFQASIGGQDFTFTPKP